MYTLNFFRKWVYSRVIDKFQFMYLYSEIGLSKFYCYGFKIFFCSQIDEADLEAELEALGDELEADVDSSYLDEALNAPGVPSREPGAASKVRLSSWSLWDILWSSGASHEPDISE